MAAIPVGPNEDTGQVSADSIAAAGVILPASAYDEPVFTSVPSVPGAWLPVAGRDIQRAAIYFFRPPSLGNVFIRSGSNAVFASFVIAENDTLMVLRYVDFLTVVTGEFWIRSDNPETITVGTVRRI